jgi:hypothetical protein
MSAEDAEKNESMNHPGARRFTKEIELTMQNQTQRAWRTSAEDAEKSF